MWYIGYQVKMSREERPDLDNLNIGFIKRQKEKEGNKHSLIEGEADKEEQNK